MRDAIGWPTVVLIAGSNQFWAALTATGPDTIRLTRRVFVGQCVINSCIPETFRFSTDLTQPAGGDPAASGDPDWFCHRCSRTH